MTVGERIRELRTLRNITQEQLASFLKVTSSSISEWERDKNEPRAWSVQRMADLFGVSSRYIMEGIEPEICRDGREPYTTNTTAPLYGRIAAGKPIEAMPVEDKLWVPPHVLAAHPRGFYLRVEGESMNRVLPNGCFAFVDPEAEVSSGEVAALHINGHDATIKRVQNGASSLTLVPDSSDPAFTDQIFDYTKPGTETVSLIGRVVWYLPQFGERL